MEMQKKNVGIYIYIDDKLDSESAPQQLVKSFSTSNCCYVPFKEFPAIEYIDANSYIIKMVIMDWTLWEEGETNPLELSEKEKTEIRLEKERHERHNSEFIKTVLGYNIPIVIFTRHNEDYIYSKLEANDVLQNGQRSPLLLVSQKKDSVEGILDEWHNSLPSVYVHEVVSERVLKAQNEFFGNLIAVQNTWIRALWELYCHDVRLKIEDDIEAHRADFENVSNQFCSFIINGIKNRIGIIPDLANEKFISAVKAIEGNKEDTKKLLEDTRYLDGSKISTISVLPGDIYGNERNWYVNIRAECDTARLEDGKTQVYLLKGRNIPEDKFIDSKVCSICLEEHEVGSPFLGQTYYELRYYDANFTIPFICGGKIIQFPFNKMYVGDYDSHTESVIVEGATYKRLGRVLPPYSLKLQQRFSQYFSRIGLDAIPEVIVKQ